MKIYQPLGARPRLREPDASAFRLILGKLQSAARLKPRRRSFSNV